MTCPSDSHRPDAFPSSAPGCCGRCACGGWDASRIPDQTGRLALVTGATGGLGFETALELARAGAEVVLGGRDEGRGRLAVARILAECPGARVAFEGLDLASLASVKAFADRFDAAHGSLDLLVNNAGVMAVPTRQVTEDGFERQLGTNHLGPFALTLRLLPALRRGRASRVVNLASLAHRQGRIDFEDLQGARRYAPWKAYAQSKLAMLLFARELQRRSDAEGWGLTALAAHPGWARTDLMAKGPMAGGRHPLLWGAAQVLGRFLGQSAAMGALPTLYAATAPEARGGRYYGPGGFGELKGFPAPAALGAGTRDRDVDARLWQVSEQLTGLSAASL